MKVAATLLALLIAALVASYAISRQSLPEMNAAVRAEVGGQYLQTELGVLAYNRQGAETAPLVVLVHGFSTPKFVWDQVAAVMVAAGYQVLSYDHLGRGYSDRPAVNYDVALYQAELRALLDGLGLREPVILVGYSMGGANVVDFAAAYPQSVSQLILVAPAGYIPDSALSGVLRAPFIGDWLMSLFSVALTTAGLRSDVETEGAPLALLEQFEHQAGYRGYTDALLSTLRHYPMGDRSVSYKALGKRDIPVTAIWGTEDEIVPYSGASAMQLDLPQLQLIPVQGGKHNITYVQAAAVAEAILGALPAVD